MSVLVSRDSPPSYIHFYHRTIHSFVKLSMSHHPLIRYSSSLRRLTVESVSRRMNSPPALNLAVPFRRLGLLQVPAAALGRWVILSTADYVSSSKEVFFIQIQVRVQVLFRNSGFESKSSPSQIRVRVQILFHSSGFKSESSSLFTFGLK